MTDLLTIDPATAMPSAELNALIATEWIEWYLDSTSLYWTRGGGMHVEKAYWSPTTNAAHAGEARRHCDKWAFDPISVFGTYGIGTQSEAWHEGSAIVGYTMHVFRAGKVFTGTCLFSEVTGSTDDERKERAEALATCRAILAAIQARHKQAEKGGK